jgi:hypothetical protein
VRDHRPDYEEAGAVVLFCDGLLAEGTNLSDRMTGDL